MIVSGLEMSYRGTFEAVIYTSSYVFNCVKSNNVYKPLVILLVSDNNLVIKNA